MSSGNLIAMAVSSAEVSKRQDKTKVTQFAKTMERNELGWSDNILCTADMSKFFAPADMSKFKIKSSGDLRFLTHSTHSDNLFPAPKRRPCFRNPSTSPGTPFFRQWNAQPEFLPLRSTSTFFFFRNNEI